MLSASSAVSAVALAAAAAVLLLLPLLLHYCWSRSVIFFSSNSLAKAIMDVVQKELTEKFRVQAGSD